jgi:hypothetical protein
MSERTLILKEKKPFTYQFSAFTLLLFGIIFILNGFSVLLGTLLSLIAIFFLIMTRGTEIDFDKRTCRKVKIFGNIIIGNRVNLPEITYISLFRTIMGQKLNNPGRGIYTEISEHYIVINLIHGNNKRITVYKSKDFNDALSKAKLIAEKLDLKIYDATSVNRKWLK